MSNMSEKGNALANCGATVDRKADVGEQLKVRGHYRVKCYGKDGKLKWEDEIFNVVTTVGANEILDEYLAGSAYTASLFMGLKGVGSAVIGDTQASHGAWLEQGLANAPTYTGNRPVPTLGAAAAKVKATSSDVSFAITSSGTVAGVFVNQGGTSTKDNTTGVLLSAGDFSGGNKAVDNGDTLNVSWQLGL